MISVAIKTSNTRAIKQKMARVRKQHIPLAMVSAGKAAAKKVVSASKRPVAAKMGIAQKYIATRFRASGGKKKKPQSRVTLLYNDINVSGTTKYPHAMSSTYRITKTGRKGKGHGRLKAIGGSYENAWPHNASKGHKLPLVLQRTTDKRYPIKAVKIKMRHAPGIVKANARRYGTTTYNKAFKRDLNRRIRGYGTR